MLLKNLHKIIICSIFIYLPFSTMAWGVIGHRVVGEIADHYLTPKAKANIFKILGNESIAMASNYADFIKSDTNMAYVSPWHYVNVPAGKTFSEFEDFLKNDTSIDAYTKLNFMLKELKSKKITTQNKLFYLRLVIHIVGDLHQPLHVGRAEDQGGNKIKVSWFNAYSNLHRVWDEQLISSQLLSYTEYAKVINYPTVAQKKLWLNQSFNEWLFDTYQTVNKIYADIKPDEKLDYQYNFKYVSTLNNQLLKGGIHLAGILNNIYGK